MIELWFALVAFTLSAYVVMDGFDLGAGALHLLVARNDAELRAAGAVRARTPAQDKFRCNSR